MIAWEQSTRLEWEEKIKGDSKHSSNTLEWLKTIQVETFFYIFYISFFFKQKNLGN